ncbi:MAG: four helix bundle protein [bacterium]|nr:four helix bundle protein [bacterium]
MSAANRERGTMNGERRLGTKDEGKITSFFDLDAWQEAYTLTLLVYQLTKTFPKDELYALKSQVRRAVISVTSNIAEGFARDTYADKAHFYVMAHASISESISQMYVAKGLGYITEDAFESFIIQANRTYAILRGLIRSTKEKMK